MLEIAEDVIRHAVESGGGPPTRPAAKHHRLEDVRRGTFVTLHVDGNLQGCIGSLEPRGALADDIAHNAFRAAFHDPRFPPLREEQLPGLEIHISVLGELEPIDADSESDLVSSLEVGADGLLLVSGARRGTFLPSVWDKVDQPELFVRFLKRKAGIPLTDWPEGIECYRYSVQDFARDSLHARP